LISVPFHAVTPIIVTAMCFVLPALMLLCALSMFM